VKTSSDEFERAEYQLKNGRDHTCLLAHQKSEVRQTNHHHSRLSAQQLGSPPFLASQWRNSLDDAQSPRSGRRADLALSLSAQSQRQERARRAGLGVACQGERVAPAWTRNSDGTNIPLPAHRCNPHPAWKNASLPGEKATKKKHERLILLFCHGRWWLIAVSSTMIPCEKGREARIQIALHVSQYSRWIKISELRSRNSILPG